MAWMAAEREMAMIMRGEIYCADLSPVKGSEQGGVRPVLILQNNVGNRYSPTVIVAPITSQLSKASLPTHVGINSGEGGLDLDSVVLAEQIRTLDKCRLRRRVGALSGGRVEAVERALLIALGMMQV